VSNEELGSPKMTKMIKSLLVMFCASEKSAKRKQNSFVKSARDENWKRTSAHGRKNAGPGCGKQKRRSKKRSGWF
jgi:hypothetical protein